MRAIALKLRVYLQLDMNHPSRSVLHKLTTVPASLVSMKDSATTVSTRVRRISSPTSHLQARDSTLTSSSTDWLKLLLPLPDQMSALVPMVIRGTTAKWTSTNVPMVTRVECFHRQVKDRKVRSISAAACSDVMLTGLVPYAMGRMHAGP